jgi:halimadienyl-diphosphate synthase
MMTTMLSGTKMMFNLKQDGGQLLSQLGQTEMSNTAYDTAWVARVPGDNGFQTPAFPEALEWLRRNQYPNGSWGSSVEYYHDRIISTLAAILALAERGDPVRDATAIQRGKRYIQEKIHSLHHDAFETVGFELILPTLLAKAHQLGLDLPDILGNRYERIREEKLKRIPPELIYSRQITTAHSLEFMGSELDVDQIAALQEENGSFGNSPSATAYFLAEHRDDAAARRYLTEIVKVGAGAARPLHPVEIFNMSWVLYNLDLAGLLDELEEQARPHLEYLYQAWGPQRGVGFSRQYSVPDLDDTAVVFKLLYKAGYDVHPQVFKAYEGENHFICFPYERNPSVGVHVHLLDALRVCPDYADQAGMVEKVLNFYRTEVCNGYLLDKWHVSPYYILSHAAIAFIGQDDQLAREKIACILAAQRSDGSWGYYAPSAEETAYCLQALMVYHRQVEPIDSAVTYHAAQYLYNHYQTQNYPALWIDKCLYSPLQIVRSAILSALWLYETQ